MATITLKNAPVHTQGDLPAKGSKAPDFRLTGTDMSDFRLSNFSGKRVILNIFPSLHTGICASSMRKFNMMASKLDNTSVICVSKDLPFSFKNFCGAEGIDNLICGSEFRDTSFSSAYGVIMQEGSMEGLMSRAIVVVDTEGTILYTEQVPEIGQEPDYEAAIAAAQGS